jgi:hypothetical protein
MIKKRLSLSLVALIGSVFLFVIASFAWFNVSELVNIGGDIVDVQDIDVSAILYESDDDVIYTVATSIDFENQVPGDTKYYKLEITNNNSFDIYTQASLYGFTETYTDIGGDTSNYTEGRHLSDVLLISASNNKNGEVIEDHIVSSLIFSDFLITHENVIVTTTEPTELYISFTMPVDTGNNYQNLQLSFSNMYVKSVG